MESKELIIIFLLFALLFGCTVFINQYYDRLRRVQERLPFEQVFSESLTNGTRLAVTTVRREVFICYVVEIEALKNLNPQNLGVTLAVVKHGYVDTHNLERHLTSPCEGLGEVALAISRDRILNAEIS